MASHQGEQAHAENLQLYVSNTFFHVKDANLEAQKAQIMRRSSSDSSLSSRSHSSEDTKGIPGVPYPGLVNGMNPFHRPEEDRSESSQQGCPAHVLFETPPPSSAGFDSGSGSENRSLLMQSGSGSENRPLGFLPGRRKKPSTSSEARQHGAVASSSSGAMQPGGFAPGYPVEEGAYSAGDGNNQYHLQSALSASCAQSNPVDQRDLAAASLQSIRHDNGLCKPCLFWFKNACNKGARCPYCHLTHAGQKTKRVRPSKQTRQKMREEEAAKAATGNA